MSESMKEAEFRIKNESISQRISALDQSMTLPMQSEK
jgi:hypothetical protein